MQKTARGQARNFLESIRNTTTDECIIWPFARIGRGYGALNVNRKVVPAHRVMCEMAHGKPPMSDRKVCVRHSCGNGHLGCVNPRHLGWGTYSENYQDAVNHGTCIRGSRSQKAVLSEDDVRTIRRLHAEGNHTQRQLAKMFGVSFPTMHSVVHRVNWAWLD